MERATSRASFPEKLSTGLSELTLTGSSSALSATGPIRGSSVGTGYPSLSARRAVRGPRFSQRRGLTSWASSMPGLTKQRRARWWLAATKSCLEKSFEKAN